jgi:hypothetical protein
LSAFPNDSAFTVALSSGDFGFCFINTSGKYMVATDQSTGFTSSDYGVSWTNTGLPVGYGTCYINGDGRVQWLGNYVSFDYGATFTAITPFFPSAICSDTTGKNCWGATYGSGAVGTSFLSKSTDYGQTWTTILSGITQFFTIACSASGQYIIAGSNTDNALVSNDFGVSWTSTSVLPPNNVTGYSVSASGQYMLAGYISGSPGVYISNDFGATFLLRTLPVGQLRGTSVSASGQYIIANTTDNLYLSNDFGQSFTQKLAPTALTGSNVGRSVCLCPNAQFILAGVCAICGSGSGGLYVGKIVYTTTN